MSRDPRPDGSDEARARAWSSMRTFVEAHNRHAELAEALGFRLGGGRGKILFQVRERPMTLSELAEANNLDAPYVTLIVDKLQAHGLVERRPHPDDRRRRLVTITTAGRDATAMADGILLRPPTAMNALTDEDVRLLTGLTARLLSSDETGRQ